jgi:hypothetical protein
MGFVKGISVLDMESYPLLGFRDMPEIAGVYFVFDDKGVVWYVGQTQNVRKRFEYPHDHKREFLRFVAYARVAYVPVEDAEIRAQSEIGYIQALAPDLNVLHRPANVPTLYSRKSRQYAKFAKGCNKPLDNGYIPMEDYHSWVLGAEPLFPEPFVRAQVDELFLDIPRYYGGRKNPYLNPEHLPLTIYDYFWVYYRQPQYEVPKLPRKVKP